MYITCCLSFSVFIHKSFICEISEIDSISLLFHSLLLYEICFSVISWLSVDFSPFFCIFVVFISSSLLAVIWCLHTCITLDGLTCYSWQILLGVCLSSNESPVIILCWCTFFFILEGLMALECTFNTCVLIF